MAAAAQPRAVIDLGTNTFHLLICRLSSNGQLEELYRERRFIKLAEAGIERIGPAPYARGQAALLQFRQKMDEFGVADYRALGTAALRRAVNGAAFIAEAQTQAKIHISLISGDEEARLIAQGVSLALGPGSQKEATTYLIMDIGGGSVEFILLQKGQTLFAQSFPVGVAVLYRQFHHAEPIAIKEKAALTAFLDQQLQPLLRILKNHPADCLVGAAGTFDVLAKQAALSQPTPQTYLLEIDLFRQLHDRIVASDLEGRLQLAEVPTERVDMIVVAMLLIQYVLEAAQLQKALVSTYAMKEGALAEMMKA